MGLGLTTYNTSAVIENLLKQMGIDAVESALDGGVYLRCGNRIKKVSEAAIIHNKRAIIEAAEDLIAKDDMNNTTSYNPYPSSVAPGGAGGSIYGLPSSYCSSFCSSIEPYEETAAEKKARLKREAEYERNEKKRQQIEAKRHAARTLADLSDKSKERVRAIILKAYKEYVFKQEVKTMTTGIKWFLIFLGLAILVNFGHILKIIELMVK